MDKINENEAQVALMTKEEMQECISKLETYERWYREERKKNEILKRMLDKLIETIGLFKQYETPNS